MNSSSRALVDRYRSLAEADGTRVIAMSETMILIEVEFAAFEGTSVDMPFAMLALCLQGGGPTWKRGKGIAIDAVWQPGTLGLALPDQPARGATPAMRALCIAFSPDLFAGAGHRAALDLRPIANRLFDDPLAAWMMTALRHSAQSQGMASPMFRQGLYLLLERLGQVPDRQQRRLHGGLRGGRLAPAIACMEANLAHNLPMATLARGMGMDARTFTRAFKRETGRTPFAYFTHLRMEHARALLEKGSGVTEAAMAVGYSNPAKFAAAFRRTCGQLPSHWRQGGEP
ncbi:AraC family transcriptional regulator [Novosphingobium sp. 1949]|uniref:AraC family transcriptional regulator n=1 Tax=Novosphingobium organovorum TaxID=2930092 RepID=A0ABT0BBW0_9SPHN|nr:AraC family transcriptional regulator [Novosphingobium organovorum]MCJ2182542.1 AraC family transcriptional regulator [Novosphingobium organovorum]